MEMVDLEITYCQPCGHQPRAIELVNQLLAEYGMPLNKKLTVALRPADSGIFDIVLDGRLIFSRMIPSIFTASEKTLPCSTASLPVSASTTRIVRSGFVTLTIFRISSRRFLLFCILPAVSIRTAFIR